MSVSIAIRPSEHLAAVFADAVRTESVRFIKVSIANEVLVHDLSIPANAAFMDDLVALQDPAVLADTVPAYILARHDLPSKDWLIISYVPDAAPVRDKMLYAATRGTLLKALGASLFSDALFATGKSDFTPHAYAVHRANLAAPKPLSAREQELADLRAAENEAAHYKGSQVRTTHVGRNAFGFTWPPALEETLVDLARGDACTVVVISIDPASESLVMLQKQNITVDALSITLPLADPCYAVLAWPHAHAGSPRREIVFIYSCPSDSPIKHRMIYSSGALVTANTLKDIIQSAGAPTSTFAARKIQTSDPAELDEAFLVQALGYGEASEKTKNSSSAAEIPVKSLAFSKPRGPARTR